MRIENVVVDAGMAAEIVDAVPSEEKSPPTLFFRTPEWALAAAIILLAVTLRLHAIGQDELWLDEASSFQIATAADWVDVAVLNNTPPLYYVLLRGWIGVFGNSETAVRSLSAVFGTLFVAAIIWFGWTIFHPAVGLWAGLWAAVAPIHVYYSQEARAYTLVTLFLLLTYAFLWRALATNRWRPWAAAAVCGAGALYSHYLAIFGLVPSFFVVLLWPAGGRWPRYGAALAACLALVAPWVLWSFVFAPHSLEGAAWIGGIWEKTPPILAIPKTLEVFGLGSQAGLLPVVLRGYQVIQFPAALRLLGLSILVLLAAWALVPQGDAALAIPALGRRKALLVLVLLVPLAALWLASVIKPIYVAGRYDIVAYPAYPLLLGLACAKLQRVRGTGPALAAAAAVLLLVPIAAKLFLYYRQATNQGFLITAARLHRGVDNGDLVVFTDLRGLPILYQMSRLGYRWEDGYCENRALARRFACRMFPRETEQTPGAYDPRRVLQEPATVRDEVADLLLGVPPSAGKVHVVLGKFARAKGQLAATKIDTLLLDELQHQGFRKAGADVDLGIIEYQRATGEKSEFRSQNPE